MSDDERKNWPEWQEAYLKRLLEDGGNNGEQWFLIHSFLREWFTKHIDLAAVENVSKKMLTTFVNPGMARVKAARQHDGGNGAEKTGETGDGTDIQNATAEVNVDDMGNKEPEKKNKKVDKDKKSTNEKEKDVSMPALCTTEDGTFREGVHLEALLDRAGRNARPALPTIESSLLKIAWKEAAKVADSEDGFVADGMQYAADELLGDDQFEE